MQSFVSDLLLKSYLCSQFFTYDAHMLRQSAAQQNDAKEFGQPSAKWLSLRCLTRTTFVPVSVRINYQSLHIG